jgi:hypothetical protein
MTDKNLPSMDYLHKRLRYEPETGKLFWRDCDEMPKNWLSEHRNKEAFTATTNLGYKTGGIRRRLFKAHRVIWAMCKGRWPEKEIDHINGDRSDNRIENLREADRSGQGKNMAMRRDNKSGFSGVCFHKSSKKWVAQIYLDGVRVSLGYFKTKEEAAAKRKIALLEAGFSERHGEPSNANKVASLVVKK